MCALVISAPKQRNGEAFNFDQSGQGSDPGSHEATPAVTGESTKRAVRWNAELFKRGEDDPLSRSPKGQMSRPIRPNYMASTRAALRMALLLTVCDLMLVGVGAYVSRCGVAAQTSTDAAASSPAEFHTLDAHAAERPRTLIVNGLLSRVRTERFDAQRLREHCAKGWAAGCYVFQRWTGNALSCPTASDLTFRSLP